MHALKVFVLLALTTIAPFIACSYNSHDYESFEIGFERANTFFSIFGSSVTDKLYQISSQLVEIEELSRVCPLILSFSTMAGEQLFSEVLVNYYNEDRIYEAFLIFFNETIGLEFDQIKRGLHSNDEYDFDPYIGKFASDLKDAIVSGVKSALNSTKPTEIQRPIPRSSTSNNFKSIADSDDFDEITGEFSKPVSLKDENSQQVEDIDIMTKYSQSNSPNPTPDLALEAKSILFYGIRSGHELFTVAKAYIQFLHESDLKLINPNSIFYDNNLQLAYVRNFDIGSPGFQEFCNYVECSIIPITSPLYDGPFVPKLKISEVKKKILTNLAVEKMQQIVETFNYDEMIINIQQRFPEIEFEILECFINHMREQAHVFLLTLNIKTSFSSGLKTTVKAAYKNIQEVFDLSFDKNFSKVIIKTFLSIFESPLALIKRYDSLEDWKSYYDESSPTYKPKVLSPIEECKSSGRKSVKIVEDNNEVCYINRISDIEREFIEKENIIPIKRSSRQSNLNDWSEIDLLDGSSQFSIFDDSTHVVKNLSPIPVSSKDTPNLFEFKPIHKEASFSTKSFSVFEKVEKRTNRYLSSEVPDFPFEDSSEIVTYPDYISATGHYFLEHGDNSCFMLDERIYSIKEGISTFLSESFEDTKTTETVMNIIEKSLKVVFKS